jgi:uncharacterized membrane protein YdjX (TVP38/TMEM64 family)
MTRRLVQYALVLAAFMLAYTLAVRASGLTNAGLVRHWLALAQGPFAIPAALLLFAALAFIGAPQFALIAAMTALYGPVEGAALSWIATMGSAGLGWFIGRAGWWKPAEADAAIIDALRRRGFWVCAGVRLVPLAPFVVINIAAGLAGISARKFLIGTAVGILPKIVLIAAARGALLSV